MTIQALTQHFTPGGYRYIPAVFQYSGGVAAEPGFALVRMRFERPLALADAFNAVEAHLAAVGRPVAAFAHCELRSPAPFSEEGFVRFNRAYVERLQAWGIFPGGNSQNNPVARTNVCPVYGPPSEPSMFAFAYTVPEGRSLRGGFMVAGSGEAREAAGQPYRDRIIALHDASVEGMRAKVECVIEAMRLRLFALGLDWTVPHTTQVYTVLNIGHLVGECLARDRIVDSGAVWHYARPPVEGLDFEMDVNGAASEGWIR